MDKKCIRQCQDRKTSTEVEVDRICHVKDMVFTHSVEH